MFVVVENKSVVAGYTVKSVPVIVVVPFTCNVLIGPVVPIPT